MRNLFGQPRPDPLPEVKLCAGCASWRYDGVVYRCGLFDKRLREARALCSGALWSRR